MAVQGSGLGKGPDPAMKDQTSYNARSGAAKKPQTDFPVHPGMTDQQKAMAGVSPASPGSGPDASGPSPLDPTKVHDEERVRDYPPGRYEHGVQAATEAGDQKWLDELFARRTSDETLRLGLYIIAFALAVAAVFKFVIP